MIKQIIRKSAIYRDLCLQTFRNIQITSTAFIPRNFRNDNIVPENHDKNDRENEKSKFNASNDIEMLTAIEDNLFGNAEKQYKPANLAELLKQYNNNNNRRKIARKQQNLPRRKQNLNTSRTDDTDDSISNQLNKDKKLAAKSKYTIELDLPYKKLNLNDPLVSKLILAAKLRKQQQRKKNNKVNQQEQIIVEGRQLILDAISAGCKIRTLFFAQKDKLDVIADKIRPFKNQAEIYKIPQQNLNVWSSLTTCPGLIAIFDKPNYDANTKEDGDDHDHDEYMITSKNPTAFPITVVCDSIREPNNLGSIIRTCAALPCTQVIVLHGSCDPWETKALRGGCGGQFHIRIQDDITWENLEKFLPRNFSLFIAENNLDKIKGDQKGVVPHVIPYFEAEVSTDGHNVLIIGGETHGISNEAYEFLYKHMSRGSLLHIPIAEGINSLNTASALTLILFEMRKLIMTKKSLEKNPSSEENAIEVQQ